MIEMRTRTCFVRAPMALATSSGVGMYPSGDWWCSPNPMRVKPRSSAHSHMSSAAR
jgi:hypothetical protein